MPEFLKKGRLIMQTRANIFLGVCKAGTEDTILRGERARCAHYIPPYCCFLLESSFLKVAVMICWPWVLGDDAGERSLC